jgi:hypothetical protein
MKRYGRLKTINGDTRFETSYAIPIIRENIANGNIRVLGTSVLQEKQRLDTIAGQVYGDGGLWWIIAAASGIGWMCQTPPGTLITIPDLQDVFRYLGD